MAEEKTTLETDEKPTDNPSRPEVDSEPQGNQSTGSNQKCTIRIVLFIVITALIFAVALALAGVAYAVVTITQHEEEIQALEVKVSDQRKELDQWQHNISTFADEIAALHSRVAILEDKLESNSNVTALTATIEAIEQSNGTCPECLSLLASLNQRQIKTTDQLSSSVKALSAGVAQLWNQTSELIDYVDEVDEHLNNSIRRVETDLRSEIALTESELRSLLNITAANATSEIRREVQTSIDATALQLRSEIDGTEQQLSSIQSNVANLAGLPAQVTDISSKVEGNKREIDKLRNSISRAAALHAIPALLALVTLFYTIQFS